MARKAVNARDRGLETIRRINRWMIAGAIGLSGVVSVAAAKNFHGHATAHSSRPAQTQTSSTPAPSSGSPSDDGGSLQPPAQAPAPAPAPQGPAVSSGGS
jgi:hypothetical protein